MAKGKSKEQRGEGAGGKAPEHHFLMLTPESWEELESRAADYDITASQLAHIAIAIACNDSDALIELYRDLDLG